MDTPYALCVACLYSVLEPLIQYPLNASVVEHVCGLQENPGSSSKSHCLLILRSESLESMYFIFSPTLIPDNLSFFLASPLRSVIVQPFYINDLVQPLSSQPLCLFPG